MSPCEVVMPTLLDIFSTVSDMIWADRAIITICSDFMVCPDSAVP